MDALVFKDVLVLAPHTDDGELGAGGFIAKLIESGARVTYAAFSTAEKSVPKHLPKNILKTEVVAATSALGIAEENLIILDYEVRKLNYARQDVLEDLISIRNSNRFDLVLVPSLNDIHQDHKTIAEEGLRAFKEYTVFGYELIWNNLSFDTTAFVKLSEAHVESKIQALKCYTSQNGKDYMDREFIKSLAKVRGVQIGVDYAEAYEVIRLRIGSK